MVLYRERGRSCLPIVGKASQSLLRLKQKRIRSQPPGAWRRYLTFPPETVTPDGPVKGNQPHSVCPHEKIVLINMTKSLSLIVIDTMVRVDNSPQKTA
ncbi:hypothetical protein RRG08_048167 [Elysia crispata]|uniref:Uncharacterized protein n=1 Tax=Elysia crispata TaxID=231223 RepID=A0AAE0ZIG4_9GAST|nr:hypothetical protein RRG08_048167 [Elysia crispata]